MTWVLPFHTNADEPLPEPGLPRRLLRHLFEGRGVGIGSQILDVGCGNGELLRFLDQLGLAACGLESSLENVAESRNISPQLTCLYGTPEDALPFPDHQFDVVLARELSVYDGDLSGAGPLCATARLLAAVRPGGHLFVIRRNPRTIVAGRDYQADHHPECFQNHLEMFGNDVHLARIGDTWNWMTRFLPKSRYLAVAIHVPAEPVSLNEWLRIALRAAHVRTRSCCEPTADSLSRTSLQRRAT